jgi:hypothetical protein
MSAIWADLSEGCVDSFLSNERFRNLNQANGGLIYLDEYFFTVGPNGEARLQASIIKHVLGACLILAVSGP